MLETSYQATHCNIPEHLHFQALYYIHINKQHSTGAFQNLIDRHQCLCTWYIYTQSTINRISDNTKNFMRNIKHVVNALQFKILQF